VLRDGRMFSFWGAIGAPTPARGYVAGRAIVADRLDESIGGGLCQLSGALYELALRGGLEIVERRAHSHDLYSEAERFTPLGLDATVVFGFTDLRFRNRTGATIAFRLQVDDDELSVALCASAPLELFDLRVNSSECAGGWVETQVEKIVADGSRRDVIRQRYLRLSDDGGETEAQAARQSRR